MMGALKLVPIISFFYFSLNTVYFLFAYHFVPRSNFANIFNVIFQAVLHRCVMLGFSFLFSFHLYFF